MVEPQDAYRIRDERLARLASLALHALLALALLRLLSLPKPVSTVIFTVETVSGLTPLGAGSGAPGEAPRASNSPANPNPLAGGLRLNADDAPQLPKPEAAQAKPKPKDAKPIQLPPSQGDLEKRYTDLKIGVDPKNLRLGLEPSEGGLGNKKMAGAEGGIPGMEGPIAGRGHTVPDFSYGKTLPEESEVIVLVTVNARGDVVGAGIKKTSGYLELDNHVLTKAREIRFDPLPSGMDQADQTGTIPFRFEYSGQVKRQGAP